MILTRRNEGGAGQELVRAGHRAERAHRVGSGANPLSGSESEAMLRHVEVPIPSDADGDVAAYGALIREFVGAVVAEPAPKRAAMARQDDHVRMFSAWCEAEGLGALAKTVLVSNGGKQEMALVPLVDAETGTLVVAKPVCGTRIRTRDRSALVAGGRLAVARRACARGRRRSSATCSRSPAARFARRCTAVRRTTATR